MGSIGMSITALLTEDESAPNNYTVSDVRCELITAGQVSVEQAETRIRQLFVIFPN